VNARVKHSWTPRRSLRSLLGGLALAVALLGGVGIPVGYALVEYVERTRLLSFKAELNANRLAKYIYSHEQLWQYQRERLGEIIELPRHDETPLRQRIVDASGRLVLQESVALVQPVVVRSAPIVVKGVVVGRVEVEQSLTAVLGEVAWVVLTSIALGAAAYLAFRFAPMRVIDRALGELELQNTRFDSALNNMSQGLSMFDREHRLVVCNQRYVEIYDLPPELVRPGTAFHEIMRHRVKNRLYAVDSPEDYAYELASTIDDDLPLARVVELRDGRAIVVKRRPMADGGWVATHEDITEQRRIEARIAHMALHDGLTDLPNRVLFRERLEEALVRGDRGEQVAVLCMDLDRFKEVNDTLGHPMGDVLLKIIAERLRSCIRDTDTVARIGGDEFAVLQHASSQPASAEALARRIIDAISQPYSVEGQQVVLGTSVGVAVAPTDGDSCDQLLKNADLALYRSKGDGRGTYRFFEAGMDAAAQARRVLDLDLRAALGAGAFELHYQPLVNLDRNEVSTLEALLRWNHPERGRVLPGEFIPLAEETGLIVAIGAWVLRQACAEAAGWPDQVRVAVNLSAVQFNAGNIVELVSDALSVSGLSAGRLELEITESALLANSELAFATLHKLREMGVHVALDDFGVGYSSLSYLRQFAFDKVKIDRSFIRDMGTDIRSIAIIQTVIGLGASLDMETVAEGVETCDQLDCLRAFGCTEVQGYYISQPRPAADVAMLLTSVPAKTSLAA
jgi:diguanylate cyclase (GGDEF)-like protein